MDNTVVVVVSAVVGSVFGASMMTIGGYFYFIRKKPNKVGMSASDTSTNSSSNLISSKQGSNMKRDISDAEMTQTLTDPEGNWYNSTSLPTYRALAAHVPKRKDELALNVGDEVTISMSFTDGWVHGVNYTTMEEGLFPIEAVKPEIGKAVVYDEASPVKSDASSAGKLLHSMVPPDQAMEIVTDGFGTITRSKYFDISKIPHQRTSMDNLGDSWEKIPTSEEESASKKPSRIETRAQKNWTKLRMNWRELLRNELESSYEDWQRRRSSAADEYWDMLAAMLIPQDSFTPPNSAV